MYLFTGRKMNQKLLMLLTILFFVNSTFSLAETLFEAPLELDVCEQVCAENALQDKTATQCERGCRFFNIAMNTNWSVGKSVDLNITKDQCKQSCSDAYPHQTDAVCFIGCLGMMQLQKDAWLFYLEQQGDTSILEIEVSLVSDPALWDQTVGTNTIYKIPQTYLRSMPIQPGLPEALDEKTWNPCTRTSDIPRWVVGLVAAILIIITVYVSYLLPSRSDSHFLIETNQSNGHMESMFYDNDIVKLSVVYHEDENCSKGNKILTSDNKLVTLNEFFSEDFHSNVIPPPKYTLFPENEDDED